MNLLIYGAPDGKGGIFIFSLDEPKRVPEPPSYQPWAKEWSFPGAMHIHTMWSIRWYQQEILRLKHANARLRKKLGL